jgi:hypothetical protein
VHGGTANVGAGSGSSYGRGGSGNSKQRTTSLLQDNNSGSSGNPLVVAAVDGNDN